MAETSWNTTYSVGINKIDEEHKQLLTMLNRAGNALKDNSANESVEIVKDMHVYAKRHFATEEDYMKRFDYPHSATHIEEHQYFVDKINKIDNESNTKDSVPKADEIYRFLASWLISHIMNEDRKLGAFMLEHSAQ